MPPFTTTSVAEAAEAWVASVCQGVNTLEHAPRELQKELPLVIGEVQRDRIELDKDASLPNVGGYQQQVVRIWNVDLLIMVDPTGDTWNASKALYDYVDSLGESLRRDPTLGQRVPSASPLYDASYDPPELEYADGTVARIVTVSIIIGEPLAA